MKVLNLWSALIPYLLNSLIQGNSQLNPLRVYGLACVYAYVHVLPQTSCSKLSVLNEGLQCSFFRVQCLGCWDFLIQITIILTRFCDLIMANSFRYFYFILISPFSNSPSFLPIIFLSSSPPPPPPPPFCFLCKILPIGALWRWAKDIV